MTETKTGSEPSLITEQPELPGFAGLLSLPLPEAREKLLETFERTMIQAALNQHDGNVSAAARRLGIHCQSLQQKMTLLGIRRHNPAMPCVGKKSSPPWFVRAWV